MKKAMLVLAVAALAMASCGGSTDSDPDAAAATTTTVQATTTAAPTTTVAPTTTAALTTTTVVPTTTTAEPAITPGEDVDVDAVVTAYSVAFDSTSDYETKVPFLEDPNGLEDTVAAYLTTGETMGGVSVVVTAVVINGVEADVTYDLLFNNNPTYPDLPGKAVLNDGGWQVPRKDFCALMSSARVGCPAE
ncbi:MAG: hypothetical protein QNL12_05850 [Acidimicrobiia bacterium]|nr:hypothetical protein [Acidimicrobiia bacterium]MDX2466817.1 hypothetical protein [Acidimicrobiia bacterium]